MNNKLLILTFHIIEDGIGPTFFPPQQFRRAMMQLHEHGYHTLHLTQAADFLRRGEPVPPRSVVLTFDDGDASVFHHAWPVLQQYNMTATVFALPPEDDGVRQFQGRPLMSWQQIRQMHDGGIEFGAHTVSHPDLTRLAPAQIDAEMCRSKTMLQDKLGSAVASFAYPFGRHDARCRQIAQQHFSCACSDALGLAHNGSDMHALQRVDAYYLRSRRLFDLIFSRHFPWYLRARNVPRRIRRLVLSPFEPKATQ